MNHTSHTLNDTAFLGSAHAAVNIIITIISTAAPHLGRVSRLSLTDSLIKIVRQRIELRHTVALQSSTERLHGDVRPRLLAALQQHRADVTLRQLPALV